MRSPWQLIKGFASRRKAEDASVRADEIVALPDPRAGELRPDVTQQVESEAPSVIKSKSTVDENEANVQPDAASAAAELPVRLEQTEPSPIEPEGGVLGSDKRRSRAVPSTQSAESEAGARVSASGSQRKAAKAPQARNSLREPPLSMKSLPEPPTAKKDFVNNAAELDLQIKNLRVQLTAKLLEQNSQLRHLLRRYDNK